MNNSEVVVGLDDSLPAKAALRWAAEQARLTGARVRAVSFVDWPLGVHADGRPVLRAAGAGQYDEVGHDYRAMISELFSEIDHVGLGKILLGSTSHHCLSHARCPVVAVPTPSPDQISPDSGEA